MRGSPYFETPRPIAHRRATLSICDRDQECFPIVIKSKLSNQCLYLVVAKAIHQDVFTDIQLP